MCVCQRWEQGNKECQAQQEGGIGVRQIDNEVWIRALYPVRLEGAGACLFQAKDTMCVL